MNQSITHSDIGTRLNEASFTRGHFGIILLCFLINVADGYDLVSMAYAAPAVSAAWQLDSAELGVIFSSLLVGMAIGGLFLAPLGDKYGRRTVTVVFLALMAASMLLTPYAWSVGSLIAARFATGLCIGAVMANVASISSEYAPQRYKSLIVIVTTSGAPVGTALAGPIANMAIENNGWTHVFLYGGYFTAALCLVALLALPESIQFLVRRQGSDAGRLARVNALFARVKLGALSALPTRPAQQDEQSQNKASVIQLFNKRLRTRTLFIWTAFFSAFWAGYLLSNWMPTLFATNGFTQSDGIFALTYFSFGGLTGAWLLAYLSTRLPLNILLSTCLAIAVATLLLWIVAEPQELFFLFSLVFLLGMTLSSVTAAMYAMATQAYPSSVRSTGVGCAAGFGRVGAILSPALAGAAISSGFDMYTLLSIFVVPALVVGAVFLFKTTWRED